MNRVGVNWESAGRSGSWTSAWLHFTKLKRLEMPCRRSSCDFRAASKATSTYGLMAFEDV